MRPWIKALGLAGAMLASAVQAAPAPAPSPAATSAGPAWWKITNGGSTLWIMGVPDGMIMNTPWNEAALAGHIQSARLLISPLLGGPPADPALGDNAIYPGKVWDYTLSTTPGGVPQPLDWPDLPIGFALRSTYFQADRTYKDSLKDRLPAALNTRVEQLLRAIPAALASQVKNGKTWEAALWLDVWNWPRGQELGNPVTTRAQGLAKNAGVETQIIYTPALWRPVLADQNRPPSGGDYRYPEFNYLWELWPNLRTQPPEAVQQKCLARVVAEAESGQMPALRTAALAAWARGDVANALKRSNSAQYCLMGDQPSTNPNAFLKKQAFAYIQALESAWLEDGETVALVEFDPLLLEDGGVLDHYRRLGFDVEEP